MNVLHDYEKMPPNYRNIYYAIRFQSGKEMHETVRRLVKELEGKQRKSRAQQKELELFQALLPFKYNDEDIHPNYENFHKFFPKTKRSTNVETRKKVNQLLIDADFIHAHTKEFVEQMREVIRSLGDEVMEEINELVLAEEKRIKDYQENAARRKRIGVKMNKELAAIAPKIIEEAKDKENFFAKLQFRKNRIGFFITPD